MKYGIISLAIYIISITTFAAFQVGRVQTDFSAYDWTLPLIVFLLLNIPAVLGFFIGRESR